MRLLAALLLWLATAPLAAEGCQQIDFDGGKFSVCSVDLATDDLRLFLRDREGQILGSFGAVNDKLAAEGAQLGVAMNAGMYHSDRAPVGLYVENGEQEMRIITSDGPGNFGLLPNGVFCIRGDSAAVIESRSFKKDRPACDFATQSGPMLVIDGKLHPALLPGSDSRYIRNGVGVAEDGHTVYLAISDQPVNFHHFARLFRDRLGTPDALFLDGNVSRLYAPQIGRRDIGFTALGPILGTVVPAD